MRKLEYEYQTKFYRKATRGIILTNDGEVFLRHVRNILIDIQRLKEDFRVVAPRQLKSLDVGSNAADSSFLLKALAAFRKDHADVQLTLRTDTSLALERMILASELHIAVINNVPSHPELLYRPYRRDKLVVFAPSNHPLTKKTTTLHELASTPLIIIKLQGGAKTFVERMFEEAQPRLKANIALRCESPDDVKTAVKRNMGLGVLLLRSVNSDIATGKFRRVRLIGVNLNMPSFIVHRNEEHLPAYARDFIALLSGRQRIR
jgi:DNA-binding transcriptional LysR family regulator